MTSMRVAFDIGGVLSKYPHIFKPLLAILQAGGAERHVVTNMHDRTHVMDMLRRNGVDLPEAQVHCADYTRYGERSKQVVLQAIKADLHIDDFPGYSAAGGALQLFVWPNPDEPYWHDTWQTDPKDGTFGRRVQPPPSLKQEEPTQ